MYEVINGTPKASTMNRNALYFKAFDRVVESYKSNPKQDMKPLMKKLAILGMKFVNTYEKPEVLTQAESDYILEYANIVMGFMANLTPSEFMNLFPIAKDYEGERWQTKDYFYTRNYMNGLDSNKIIGTEIMMLLWEYHNWEITHFNVALLGFMDDTRRLQGEPGIMEKFLRDQGATTYTMIEDDKGRKFLFDQETGNTLKVRKPRPRHLKLIR